MIGNFTGLYISGVANDALQRAKLPPIAGVDCYSTQVLNNHTVGAFGGTPLVNGASQNVTYTSVRTVMTQTLNTDGWTASSALLEGDVFTIAGVFDVNPITKATLPHLKQFVLRANATTAASALTNTALTIYPAIISSGAYQNVSAAPADNAAITYLGTAGTAYPQNLLFTKNAFALVTIPMDIPDAAVKATRRTYKGISMRLTQGYDIVNDDEMWRFDILYGVAAPDPRQAVRLSGTA
jgi:hypothetical protein